MLKHLTIRNFQAHEFSQIEFSPTVTALVGLNNHGKSAVLRALRKLVRDEPEGAFNIRDGETECRIILETDLALIERKYKSEQVNDANMYIVEMPGVDTPLEFAKFGHTGIPQEVIKALQISPIQSFGDEQFDLNFQEQLDSLFLVQGAGLPSLRGKVLGKITGADVIGRGVQICASELKKHSQSVKVSQAEFSGVTAELVQYANVEELLEQCTQFQEELALIASTQSRIDVLDLALTTIRRCITEAKRPTRIASLNVDFSNEQKALQRLTSALRVVEEMSVIDDRLFTVSHIVNTEIDVDVSDVQPSMQAIYLIEEVFVLENSIAMCDIVAQLDVEPVYTHIEEARIVVDQLLVHERINNELVAIDRSIWHAEKAIDIHQQAYDKALQELVALQKQLGVCPVCKKPF